MIVEELRKVAVDNLFTVGTFNKYWPTWQKEIKKIIGKEIKDITEDKILDLGSNLRKIFKSTGGKVRGQGEVSGGGYGWECLVAWYLNLCMANSRGIVFKFKKKLFPEAITDALTITYNRNEYLSETDILGFVFPDNENFINLKSSDQKNLIENLPGRKIVYTNGTAPYAKNVLSALGLLDVFSCIYGVEDANYNPKPEYKAYELVFKKDGLNPLTSAMFEDEPRNLKVPHQLGMKTIFVSPESKDEHYIDFHTSELSGFLKHLI